ncbi:MAG: DUF3035 domain-containing protein [Rhodobiaceae bacterium]|nr:DUF3035 domain-containing protein [Rhodobiaceae bacterium]MBT7280659.1 DUF3035 domain-containing protein [Rhodobiaceae bacterium]MDG2495886.1 DUF3035 domain-containing protein [Alphaproteobacteria bacterium]
MTKKTETLSVVSSCFKMMMVLGLAAGVAACGGDNQALGYSKNAPDEFNVVRKAPLILPPDFNLRPPSSNSARPITPSGAELARLIVLPNAPQTPIPPSEQNLLDKAARGGTFGNGIREEMSNSASGKASETAAAVEALTKDQSEAGQ